MSTNSRILALRLEMGRQRRIQKLTYDELATLSGVGRRTLIAVETGESKGSLGTWMDICQALNYDFSKFIAVSEKQGRTTGTSYADVDRVEIIDPTGRAYVKHNVSAEFQLQDSGRTLKLFLTDRESE